MGPSFLSFPYWCVIPKTLVGSCEIRDIHISIGVVPRNRFIMNHLDTPSISAKIESSPIISFTHFRYSSFDGLKSVPAPGEGKSINIHLEKLVFIYIDWAITYSFHNLTILMSPSIQKQDVSPEVSSPNASPPFYSPQPFPIRL